MKPFGVLIGVGLAVFLLWCFWASHAVGIAQWWLARTSVDINGAAAWGDAFGPFNALLSALGFAAVLATLWLQAQALKGQGEDLHRQRFESTFFELLRLLREVRSEISFQHSSDYKKAVAFEGKGRLNLKLHASRTGHSGIQAAVSELRYWLAPGRTKSGGREQIVSIYRDNIHKNNEASLGPYFRLIYTILNKLRNDSILSHKEKAAYGNLLRSQLTSEEITLLGVNALAPFAKDLDSLIIEFRMLKYLPLSSMQRRLARIYDPQAFQERD